MPPFSLSYENQFMPCECCKHKYTTTTCTATASNGFKWSKKEIEAEIIRLAEKLAKSKWYNRGSNFKGNWKIIRNNQAGSITILKQKLET